MHLLTRGAGEIPGGSDAREQVLHVNVMTMRMFYSPKICLYSLNRTKCQGDNCRVRAVFTGTSVIKAACSIKSLIDI